MLFFRQFKIVGTVITVVITGFLFYGIAEANETDSFFNVKSYGAKGNGFQLELKPFRQQLMIAQIMGAVRYFSRRVPI